LHNLESRFWSLLSRGFGEFKQEGLHEEHVMGSRNFLYLALKSWCVYMCVCWGGEGQSVPSRITPGRRAVTSSSHSHPLVEEEAPFHNT
jgi:hypothetical protein